jgi:hypothetical protein
MLTKIKNTLRSLLAKAGELVRRYWYILLIAAGAFAFWFLYPRRRIDVSPLDTIATEVEIYDAKKKIEKLEAELSTREIVEKIKAEHAARLALLSQEDKARAKQMESNPRKYVDFIVRAGRNRPW